MEFVASRRFVGEFMWVLVGLGTLLGFVSSTYAADTPRPNVLVILCDDLGYGDLGCFGHPATRTPHLDRLAAEGLRLDACYSAAPVCSPSRAGLMTGRTPYRSGIYDWIPERHPMHLMRDERTIASLLAGAGYATCHVGKWHLNGYFNDSVQPQPGDHGFTHWFSTQNNAAPSHLDPVNFVRNGSPVGPQQGFSCQLVVDEALRWLRETRRPEQPFFLFACFHEPHEPVASPPDLVAGYPAARNPDEAQYFANVENMDRAVGRLVAGLDAMGEGSRTLVYFSSDNGPETLNRYRGAQRSYGSPGPLRGMKLHLYEGGIRVPGIMRWTGRIAGGKTVAEPVCSLDLLPTCAELAGLPVPADRPLDGTSLVPLIDGKSINRVEPLYWQYYRAIGKGKVALRDGDWKLLAHWDGPDLGPGGSVHAGDCELIRSAKLTGFELYNLREDPRESTDLAAREPAMVEALAAKLRTRYDAIATAAPQWDVQESPRPKAAAKRK